MPIGAVRGLCVPDRDIAQEDGTPALAAEIAAKASRMEVGEVRVQDLRAANSDGLLAAVPIIPVGRLEEPSLWRDLKAGVPLGEAWMV